MADCFQNFANNNGEIYVLSKIGHSKIRVTYLISFSYKKCINNIQQC